MQASIKMLAFMHNLRFNFGMSSTSPILTPALTILGTSLHRLDIESNVCTPIAIPAGSDLPSYLDSLLKDISDKPQSREYDLAANTTQFATSLSKFHSSKSLDLQSAKNLADRLLRIEVKTNQRYSQLAKSKSDTQHVKRGSFLQFLFDEGGAIGYLGVKIEHQSIVDEVDFRRKIGLGDTQKIFKACRVRVDSSGVPEKATVFDTNAKPTVYWWDEVWELKPVRSDELNTSQAVKYVIHEIQKIKKTSPVDHTILRNATIAAFKQAGAMDFDKFVTDTFSSYVPVNSELGQELPSLVSKLRALPGKKNFDTHFSLVPSVVPYKKVNVKLNTGIFLTYEDGMPHLSDHIWATKIGEKDVVVIDAPDAVDLFEFRPIEYKAKKL